MRLAAHRHLRQPQPLHPEGRPRGGHRLSLRDADRPARRTSPSRSTASSPRRIEIAGRPLLGRLHAAAGGALSRRQPDHRRRRHLDLRDAAAPGPALLPRLLRGRRQGGGGRRRARCASPSRRRNRELPLILGQLPVLSQRYWATRDFTRTTLEPRSAAGPTAWSRSSPGARSPTGACRTTGRPSSPSTPAATTSTRSATTTTATPPSPLEAFKAGAYDFRQENSAKNWATGYDVPALRQGLIKKEADPERDPHGHAGVRLQHAAAGVPGRAGAAGARLRLRLRVGQQAPVLRRLHAHAELFLQLRAGLARAARRPTSWRSWSRFAGEVPDEVFTTEYRAARDGRLRLHPRRTSSRRPGCSSEAGWVVRDQQLVNAQSGQPLTLRDPPQRPDAGSGSPCPSPRTSSASASTRARPHRGHRPVPVPDRRLRLRHDRDVWGQSLSPGNEQRDYWSSATADTPGSRNLAGIKDPGRRRADRARHRRPRPRDPGRAHARPRPRAAVGPLRDPALAHPGLPRRLLGQVRPARRGAEVRARLRHLVGGRRRRRRRCAERAGRGAADALLAYVAPPPPPHRPDPVRDHGVNFVIVQAAPGRPGRADDRARSRARAVEATARMAGDRRRAETRRRRRAGAAAASAPASTAARAASTPSSSGSSRSSSASTGRRTSASSRCCELPRVRLRPELLPRPSA